MLHSPPLLTLRSGVGPLFTGKLLHGTPGGHGKHQKVRCYDGGREGPRSSTHSTLTPFLGPAAALTKPLTSVLLLQVPHPQLVLCLHLRATVAPSRESPTCHARPAPGPDRRADPRALQGIGQPPARAQTCTASCHRSHTANLQGAQSPWRHRHVVCLRRGPR